MKTVYMVEDELLLQELFQEYVPLIPNLKLIGTCGDGMKAMENCLELKPDIIVLDIRLPEVNGLEMLVLLRRKLPNSSIIIFSGSLSDKTVKMAIQCKANAFVEKAFGLEELKKAIEATMEGKLHFSPGALQIKKRLTGE